MMLHTLLTVVQVICCVAIIGLVLIQRGKGADAGAGFGAGASGTVFGARGASTALSRATAIFAAIFMINSLLLAYLGSKASTEQPKTILDEAAAVRRTTSGSSGAGSGTSTSAPAPSTAPQAAPASSAPAPSSSSPSTTPAASAPAPAAATPSQAPAPAAPGAPPK
jgi:preprotein translocase subunit SecG